ncbi:hypothetical protein ACXPWS_16285 [Mycobacterium sp. BMJ-28]
MVALICGAAAATVGVAPAGADSSIDPNAQCAYQYPADGAFQAGSAYVVAPGDAFSWRCQRVSRAPGGGIIADLGVDLANFCARQGGAPVIANRADAFSWSCRP